MDDEDVVSSIAPSDLGDCFTEQRIVSLQGWLDLGDGNEATSPTSSLKYTSQVEDPDDSDSDPESSLELEML